MKTNFISNVLLPNAFKYVKNALGDLLNGSAQMHIENGYIVFEKNNSYCYKVNMSKIKESVSSMFSI